MHRTAQTISHLLSPAGVALAVFVYLTLGAGWRANWLAGLVGIGLFALVPAGALLALRQRAALSTDVYDPPIGLRRRILLAGAVCHLLGFATLSLLPAPAVMLWAGGSFFFATVAVWLIDRIWKISIHSVGVGSGIAVLITQGGAAFWPLLGAAPLVGWARLQLGAHTPAQIAAGLVLGGGVPLAIRSLL